MSVTVPSTNPSIWPDPMKCDTPMRSCVYQGSAWSMLSKMAVIFGTTTTIITVMRPEPITIISAG